MMQKPTVLLFALLFCMMGLAACQTALNSENSANISRHVLHQTNAVTFAPDGRLWRLTPAQQHVWVDFSIDEGLTFSRPVQVNTEVQKISAWPENPPAIAVSRSGRIHVLYYADEIQKSTSFFSYSDDQGKTFSAPARVSDHAETAKHYMDKMLLDAHDNAYLFWHDLRNEEQDQKLGSSVVSLYSAFAKAGTNTFPNRFVSSAICSCCRTAVELDSGNQPVILARMVFPGSFRDHALLRLDPGGSWSAPARISDDHWRIEACPEHGPALAIDQQNRSHFVWFTLGETRQGIFYAFSDDFGHTVTEPVALGNRDKLPGHPDVIALGNRVVLAWKEFDGKQTDIRVQKSVDRGITWSEPKTVFTSSAENGHPHLLSNKHDIYLSWVIADLGHKFIKL